MINAKLHIMRAFARKIEYKTAPVAEKKRSQSGEKPISSRKLKAKNRIAKTVALAERITNELQIWVKNRGLKIERKEEKEGGEDDTLWWCCFKTLIIEALAKSKKVRVKGRVKIEEERV